VLVEADLRGLHNPVLTLREVRLEEPRIHLTFPEGGGNNMPKFRRRGARMPGWKRTVQVVIQHVAVEKGVLELEQRRIPIDLTAQQMQARFSGGGGLDLQGWLTAQDVEVKLPRARPFLGAVSLKGRFAPGVFEIVTGRVSAPDLSAVVNGTITWRRSKEAAFEVQAEGSSSFFERLGYLKGDIVGSFRFDGGFAWRPQVWGFRGDVSSPALTVFGRSIRRLSGVVSGDRNATRIDVERAAYGDGALSGLVAFDTRPGQRAVELDLTFDRVDLQRILDDQDLPVQGLAGMVSGPFTYRFPLGAARQGQGWADLTIDPIPDPTPGAMPVAGTVPLVIEEGVFRTGAARFTAESQRLLAEGSYDLERRSGLFDYRIATQEAGELFALFPALRYETPPVWLPTVAHGDVEGQLEIAPGGVSTEMRLSLFDVEAPGASADRLQGTMRIAREGLTDLRLELLRPSGGLIVTGSVPFGGPSDPTPSPVPFSLEVDAAGWPAAEAKPWLPFELPVDGPFSGSLQLAGTPERPEGRVRVEIAPTTYAGVDLDSLLLDVSFDPEQIVVHRVTAMTPAGEAVLSGSMGQVGQGLSLRFSSSEPLDLSRAPFSSILPGPLTGRLTVSGTLAGTVERPRLDANLAWRDLRLDGEPVTWGEGAETLVVWDGSHLELAGTLLGLIGVVGGGRLDRAGIDLELDVEAPDLRALAQLAATEPLPEFRASLRGVLSLAGDFSSGEPWRPVLRAHRFESEVAGHRFENLEPVVVRWQPEGLVIDSFFVAEADASSELFVAGTVGFDEERSLDLRLESSLEAEWLGLAWPELGIRGGRLDVLATVGGTGGQPLVNGQGVLSGGSFIVPALPHAVERVEAVLLFDPGQIVLDSLRAEMAGGSLQAGGTVHLAGADGPSYSFQVSGKQLNLRYPEGWLLRGDAEVLVDSVNGGRQIRGLVTLDRAFYLEDVRLGLTQLFVRRRAEVEETNELLTSTQLNILVVGPEALRVRNNVADLRGGVDLIVRGSLARPVLFGRVELDPQGTLIYGGNEYEIERGQLSFANPLRIEPVIDLVASTDVREYDVTLNLSGTPERLNVSFTSDPPLADLEVLSLLTAGEQPVGGEVAGGAAGSESVGAERLLSGQASALIAGRANRLFGLDTFQIDPLTSSSGNLSSARFTVGKRLSRDLFATVSYDRSTTEQEILQLEWQVSPGMVLVLTQNGDDTYALDARWEKSF
ncbi:MAG: translocation/assembly module TamB domain-containing protein, partial [Thermoanaerobaculia bacterium]